MMWASFHAASTEAYRRDRLNSLVSEGAISAAPSFNSMAGILSGPLDFTDFKDPSAFCI